jgi:hypothetical protein
MPTDSDISWTYARALAVRTRMQAFLADLRNEQHLAAAACTVFDRFRLEFAFFMDAPTRTRLARLLALEAEMAGIAGRT